MLFNPMIIAACLRLFLSGSAAPTRAENDVVRVRAGESIQVAINAASPGTSITVEAGTYAEQLTISKNGITIVGNGAILVPPTTPISNLCTGLANNTNAGICVHGTDVVLAPFVFEHRKVLSVGEPVEDVSITGFTINNFDGPNIAVVGASHAYVRDNSLYNGGQYGFLAVGSTNTLFSGNAVVSKEFLRGIAICADDLAGARILNNHVYGYVVGLCVQTPGYLGTYNDISNSCIGAFIDPGINGAQVLYNHFGATNPDCVSQSAVSSGIIIYGATNSVVQFNVVEGQHAGGMAAGISLVDAFEIDPSLVASGNVVTQNVLTDNDFDLFVNTTGAGNVVLPNQCETPAELCG